MKLVKSAAAIAAMAAGMGGAAADADESLLGYVAGSETLPQGAWEITHATNLRVGKGSIGSYSAIDTETEAEYGLSDRFTVSGAIKTLSIDTDGIYIDAYIPGPNQFSARPSGLEVSGKYAFKRPALDGYGLAGKVSFDYGWLDPHSGQDKTILQVETKVLAQRYFLEGQMVLDGNLALEATYAKRAPIAGLPAGFEWPTNPEMEIEVTGGAGLAYRFAPNWFVGGQVVYQTEYETVVGQERWSIFAGPSLHYGGERWWATATWFPQLSGGGETYPGQTRNLHLIEKTEQEYNLKLGLNF